MIFRFNSKPTRNGWTHQLEYNDETKEYEYGTFIFSSGNVEGMTKKQLDTIVLHLQRNGYCQKTQKKEECKKQNPLEDVSKTSFAVLTKEIAVFNLNEQYENFYIEIFTEGGTCEYYLCHKRNAIKRCMFKCLLSTLEEIDINAYIASIIREEIKRYAYVYMDDDYFDVMEMLGEPVEVDEDDI